MQRHDLWVKDGLLCMNSWIAQALVESFRYMNDRCYPKSDETIPIVQVAFVGKLSIKTVQTTSPRKCFGIGMGWNIILENLSKIWVWRTYCSLAFYRLIPSLHHNHRFRGTYLYWIQCMDDLLRCYGFVYATTYNSTIDFISNSLWGYDACMKIWRVT